jgi:L-lactate dehydrogenase
VGEVAIIGSGAVGVACAGSVLRQGLASRLVFYDRDADRALGEALDFQHAAPLFPDCTVEGRSLAHATPADVAVMRQGRDRKPAPAGSP